MQLLYKRFLPVLIVLLFSSGSSVLWAQSTATLQGTVADQSGAAIPGAKIHVHDTATGSERDVVSDSSGNYVVPSVQPGTYTVQASASGFSNVTVEHVLLQVSQTSTVNITMGVAATGEVVEVQGGAPVIDASTITVGQVINQRTVQEIPLNGRHFLDLTQLVPGTVTPPTSGSLTSPSRGLGSSAFITAGNREDSTNFMINGINLNDISQNQITFQPSINTTAEFKILNSTFSAEYGRSSGSIVNVATRSGTNQFHGELFDYIRNNDLDARNYFNGKSQPMDQFQRNKFGASLGGPIIRNRTFFFISYEGLRQSQELPLTSQVLTSAQRNAFATSQSGSQYAQLLGLIPQANDSTGTIFNGGSPGPVSVNQYTADILHKISDADQLHLYYAFQQDNRTEPNLQGNTIPGFGDHRDTHRQIGTINETHVFSSNMVNEVRVGFNRDAVAFSPRALLNPAAFGLNTGLIGDNGLPQISVSSIGLNFGGPSGFPQGRYVTGGAFSDTLNYLHGNHSVKVGGEYRRSVDDNFQSDPGTLSFSSVQNFINGQVNSFTITPGRVTSRVFINSAAGFVADTYKATKTLSLELGFRFEWNGSPTEGADRFVNFLASNVSLTRINTNGYNDVYNQNYNYEPRVGFSWDVRGDGKTVLRGGYGYLVDQPVANLVTPLATNFSATPVNYTASATAPPVFVGTVFTDAGLSGLAPNAVNPKLTNAYTESYNLNLQQQLNSSTAFQMGYIGSVGRHLRIERNINQPTLDGANRPFPALSTQSPIKPGSKLGNIGERDSDSFSDYNALWFTVRQNLSHGLEFNSTYTWSKSMDLNSLGSEGGYTLQDNFNPRGDYGLSDFDVRNRFVFSGIWTLPLHGNRLKDGWQLANITQLQSGNPFNITTSSTFNGTNATIRPDVVGNFNVGETRLPSGNVQYLNGLGCSQAGLSSQCSFFAPASGFGDLSRNAIVGPGFANADISLQKETKLTETTAFQIRADAFDFLNHPNFAQPNTSISASSTQPTTAGTTFGQITATRFPVGDLGSSRQLQFALKLIF